MHLKATQGLAAADWHVSASSTCTCKACLPIHQHSILAAVSSLCRADRLCTAPPCSDAFPQIPSCMHACVELGHRIADTTRQHLAG